MAAPCRREMTSLGVGAILRYAAACERDGNDVTTGNSDDSSRFSPKILRDVLQRLADQAAIFTLYVNDGPCERIIYFVGGGIRLLSTGDRGNAGIADYLLEKGFLPVEAVHEVLEAVRRTGRSIREVLLEKKLLTRDDVVALTNKLIRDEIMDLVFWDRAEFQLFTGSPPEELYNPERQPLVGSMDLQSLSVDACEWACRWEELRPKLLSDRAVLELTEEGERVASDPSASSHDLCAKIEAGTTLRGLARALGIEIPGVCDLAIDLVERELIRVSLSPPPTGAEGLQAEIERLEAAIPTAILPDRLHAQLADMCERARQPQKAAVHLAAMADVLARQGSWPAAVEHLKKALTLDPADTALFAKIATIQSDHGLVDDVVKLASRHTTALVESGQPEAAAAIAKELARVTGDRSRSDEILSQAMSQTGRVGSTLEQFLELASEHERNGDLSKAAELLKQALALHPDNEEVRERLEHLDRAWLKSRDHKVRRKGLSRGGRPRKASAAKISMRIIVSCVLLIVVGVLVAKYYPRIGRWVTSAASALSHSDSDANDANNANNANNSNDADSAGGTEAVRDGDGSRGGISLPHVGSVDPRSGQTERDGDPHGWLDFLTEAAQGTQGAGDAQKTRGRQDRHGARGAHGASGASSAAAGSDSDRGAVAARAIGGPSGAAATSREKAVPATRHLDRGRRAVFRHGGALEVFDRQSREPLFRLTGRAGSRWAIGYRGEKICRWRPGQRCQLFHEKTRELTTTPWALPKNTDAIAVGSHAIALRTGDRTGVYDLDGNPIVGAILPEWVDGFFTRDGLVLYRPKSVGGKRATVWVVDPATLTIRWRFEATSGDLVAW